MDFFLSFRNFAEKSFKGFFENFKKSCSKDSYNKAGEKRSFKELTPEKKNKKETKQKQEKTGLCPKFSSVIIPKIFPGVHLVQSFPTGSLGAVTTSARSH